MTFRQVADCLPEDLKTRFATSRPDPKTAFAVHVFKDDEQGADTVCSGVSGEEALEVLREKISEREVISAYATRERGDGTAQILYLCEMEERFTAPLFD
jgi:hypothetical protein